MSDDISLRFGADTTALSAGVTRVKEGVESVTETITACREAMMGLTEAFVAFFAVEQLTELARKMGEVGEQVEHTSKSLGMSTGAVQQLQADFALMGMNADKGVLGIERLDKAFAAARDGAKQQSAAFRELGVDTAKNYEQMQLLGTVMDGFRAQSDGPAKAAEAMVLFGKAGAQLIPFLDLGKTGLEELNRVTDEYTVTNEPAARAAAQLGSAFNENHVAMMGLGNVMAQSLAPALTSIVQGVNALIAGFIRSYKEGGSARVAMDFLATTLKGVASVAASVALVFEEMRLIVETVTDGAAAGFKHLKVELKQQADDLGEIFNALGRVIFDALTMNVADSGAALSSLMRTMGSAVRAEGALIQSEWHDVRSATEGDVAKMKAELEGFASWTGGLWSNAPRAQLDTTGEGKPGDTSGDAGKAGARRKAAKDAELAAQLAGDREQIEAAKASWDEELAAWAHYLGDVAAAYGKDSEQYLNALREKEAAQQAHEAKMLALAKKGIENRTREEVRGAADDLAILKIGYTDQLAVIDAAEKAGTLKVQDAIAAKAEIRAQEIEAERQALKTRLALQLEGLNEEQALLPQLSDAWQAVEDQKIELTREFWSRLRVLNAQGWAQENSDARAAVAQLQQTWHAALDPMVSSFTSGIVQMAQGMKSFRSVVLGELGLIGQGWLNNINRMVSQWAVGEATKAALSRMSVAQRTAIEAAGAKEGVAINALANMKRITSDAAAAAASAYKAMSGIFPAPLWGIAAGAAAFTGVMAFEGMASAKGGYDVPSGVNPLTQLHEREMVLPATYADPLRSMLNAYSDGGGSPAGVGGGGGDTHVYHIQIQTLETRAMERLLSANPGAVQAVIKQIVRGANGDPKSLGLNP